MTNELGQMLQTLRQPEYIHVLLNPLPVYATAMGVIALLGAIVLGSRQAQLIALVLVIIGCGSVWPVAYYGQQGYDRVLSMSNKSAKEWLSVHKDRAEDCELVFYATAALALVAIVTLWKFPRAAAVLRWLTLLGAVVSLGLGAWISHAGGQVRHPEFRDGPPAHPAQH